MEEVAESPDGSGINVAAVCAVGPHGAFAARGGVCHHK